VHLNADVFVVADISMLTSPALSSARHRGHGQLLASCSFLKTGPAPSVRTPSGGMGTYRRGALLKEPSVRTPSGGMGTYGRGALLKDRPWAVCSHALWGHGHVVMDQAAMPE
jgi:hypothetical protein